MEIIKSKKFKVLLLIIGILLIVVLLFGIIKVNNKISDTDVASNENVEESFTEEEEQQPSAAEILDEQSEIEDEGEHIFYMPKEEITHFAITDANGIMLDFEKRDGNWIYVDDESIDINEDRIDKLLNYITDVRFVDSIETENGDEYGLTQDSPSFIIYDANGYSTILSIGSVNEDTGEVYFALNYEFNLIYVNSGKLKGVSEYHIEELVAL